MLDPNQAGRWHRPWDPQLQADWMEQFYRVCLSKPFVESISWGNLADMNPSLPSGGMMDDLLQPKPVFERLHRELCLRFEHDWLLRWNLLESLQKLGLNGEVASQLRHELEKLEVHYQYRQPIASGLSYLARVARGA